MTNIAWAQTGAGASSGGLFDSLTVLAPMILVFAVFYLLMIRPQQKRMKEHQAKLAAIKRGDRIVLGGGVYGFVLTVEGEDLRVRISETTEVLALRSAVMNVVPDDVSLREPWMRFSSSPKAAKGQRKRKRGTATEDQSDNHADSQEADS